MKRVNKEGPLVLGGLPSPLPLPAERLSVLLESGAMVVDTRPADSFAARHVPGTINIPLRSLPEWGGWLVDYEQPLYLIADSDEVAEAARDLVYIGIDNLAGYFDTPAIDTMAETGQPLQSYDVIPASEVAGGILDGEVAVVDVRAQSEWDAGHIPGAVHLMLGYLPGRVQELLDGRPIAVLCRTGRRSAIGASILQAGGATNVINMAGGIRAWAAAGLPIVMRDA
jgi:hydroxyacylglutathione hydrolase